MTKTFTLTLDQIADVFRAGVACGEDSATAFEWGSRATKNRAETLVWDGLDNLNLSDTEKDVLIAFFKEVL